MVDLNGNKQLSENVGFNCLTKRTIKPHDLKENELKFESQEPEKMNAVA